MWHIQCMPFKVAGPHYYNNSFGRVCIWPCHASFGMTPSFWNLVMAMCAHPSIGMTETKAFRELLA